MKSARLPRVKTRLPKRGNSFVTITIVDENGFTSAYPEAEVPNGAIRTALATIYLEAKADAERRESANAAESATSA